MMMKNFKVYKKENDELILSYFAEEQNEIWGYKQNEIYQVELTEQQVAEEQKLEKKVEIKEVIKGLLAESDWTQLKDAHLYLTEANIAEFSLYRDLLRKQLEVATNDPWSVILPQKPEEIKQPQE